MVQKHRPHRICKNVTVYRRSEIIEDCCVRPFRMSEKLDLPFHVVDIMRGLVATGPRARALADLRFPQAVGHGLGHTSQTGQWPPRGRHQYLEDGRL